MVLATTGSSVSSSSTTTGNPPTGFPQWEYDLLTALQAPQNTVTLNALSAWAQSEGVNATDNNPLAITDPGNKFPHSGVVASNGGDPVYAFPTEAIGVQATAAFLQAGYGSVISALQQGTSYSTIFQAINSSGWCRGCQGGKYPEALAALAAGGSPSAPYGGGSAGTGSQQAAQGTQASGCGLSILGACIITNAQARAVEGYLIMGLGLIPLGLGFVGLVALGFGVRRPAQVAALAPGPVGTFARAAGGGSRASSGVQAVSRQRRATQAAADRAAAQQQASAQREADRQADRNVAAARRNARDRAANADRQARNARATELHEHRLRNTAPKGSARPRSEAEANRQGRRMSERVASGDQGTHRPKHRRVPAKASPGDPKF